MTRVFEDGDMAGGTEISFDIEGIKNPMSTAPLEGITITVIAPDGGDVDEAEAALEVSTPAEVQDVSFISFTPEGAIDGSEKVVQEPNVLRVQFTAPLPMNEGCIIQIIFPPQIGLGDFDEVFGLGMFGQKRNMTESLAGQSFTITDGCLDYLDPTFEAKLDFTTVTNPSSIEPTDSFEIHIFDRDG